MRASRALLFVLACAATLVVLTAGAAQRSTGAVQTQASFPGANGKLAFARSRGAGGGFDQISLFPVRRLPQAIFFPSGDQAGCQSLPGLSVSRATPLPSASIV